MRIIVNVVLADSETHIIISVLNGGIGVNNLMYKGNIGITFQNFCGMDVIEKCIYFYGIGVFKTNNNRGMSFIFL